MRRLPWIALLSITLMPSAGYGDQASIRVDIAHPGHAISPRLYGIFFEEINHAGDGGLYAELLRNRSLRDADAPDGWSTVGGASMTLDTAMPLNQANPRALQVVASSAGSGVSNGGYWGIPVRKGDAYRLTLYGRCNSGQKASLSARLEVSAAPVGDSARIRGVTGEWRRFTCTIKSKVDDPNARLVITLDAPGTVYLSAFSLQPVRTYKNRANGLRLDLAQKLADLNPAFVRFPGGCFCEGDQLVNAFRWKNSIGEVSERPGHWNLWGYRSTDGLGYHEYLQMCEDLGAEPLFVINCGMSHGGVVPLDQLDPWVQDALDAIEYANGPATSTWGALRARSGHPGPFNLRLMEIGNENGGPAYEERYARFYDAIKKRYPDMLLIANVPVRSRPMDIIDEHYYSSPEFFINNAIRYDDYDRKGPRIYVGEYAVTQGCGQGNLRAAVGEAAFMTGLERNSDIVTMGSYAPLLVNTNNRAWNPDAICFDSARSFGTPSYWVQQMFARNRADVVLPTEVRAQQDPLSDNLAPNGGIGLGTWGTQAEYKDVTVTGGSAGNVSLDFSKAWKVVRGDWQAADGAYRQTSMADDVRSVAGDAAWSNYTLRVKARKISGREGFLIMFRVQGDNDWFWWNIGGWGNTQHAIERCEGGSKSLQGRAVAGSIETGRWYDIKIELAGARIRCYLDGKLIHDVTPGSASPLAVVSGLDQRAGDVVLKVVNSSKAPYDTSVVLEGAGQIAPNGAAITLASQSPSDENSFENPLKVSPKTTKLTGIGSRFQYSFPPNSVTILRIPVGSNAR